MVGMFYFCAYYYKIHCAFLDTLLQFSFVLWYEVM